MRKRKYTDIVKSNKKIGAFGHACQLHHVLEDMYQASLISRPYYESSSHWSWFVPIHGTSSRLSLSRDEKLNEILIQFTGYLLLV